MRRGAWHQFGDKSQRFVIEQLEQGAGVGVILSPRDLSWNNAIEYANKYHELGAHVLIDLQFSVPGFSNSKLETYPISQYRTTISRLRQITDPDLRGFASELHRTINELSADGIVSPAVIYEAGRPDINELNARLFSVAKRVGNDLGKPTYATVILGSSATSSYQVMNEILSQATCLDSDGWYYGFEFSRERIPSSRVEVLRCCEAGLTLSCTGKPVLHAFAGPKALLSFGFGATGAAIGHAQNVWHFTRGRWGPPSSQGGGGDAPPRFFSTSLWGTIIYRDETIRLSPSLRNRVLIHSPFSTQVGTNLDWSRWSANKHFVYMICSAVTNISANNDPRTNAKRAIALLRNARRLHSEISGHSLHLGDNTNAYQNNWRLAMDELLNKRSNDFDYLELLR